MNKKNIININDLEIRLCTSEDVKDIYELQNIVIEYFKGKQGILLKTNYCGCKTLGENKEQNRFYRKGGIAAEAVLS